LLYRLEQDGLLISESEVVGGQAGKIYAAMDMARQVLAALTGQALPKISL